MGGSGHKGETNTPVTDAVDARAAARGARSRRQCTRRPTGMVLESVAERNDLEAVLAAVEDPVAIVSRTGEILAANAAYDALAEAAAGGALRWFDSQGDPLPPERLPLAHAARAETADVHLYTVDLAQVRRTYRATVRPFTGSYRYDAAGIVVFRDLTDREARMVADRFVELLSHELSAPVASLRSHAELFVRYLDDDLSAPEARFAMERVHALAGRLGLMIHDLYELARISTGLLQVKQQSLDLQAVVQRTVEVAEGLPAMPPIYVETVGPIPMLTGDNERISGVILNLLTNAAVHAHTTDCITVRLWSDEDVAAIDVEDRGPGIPPEQLPLIFSKHYRGRRSDGEHGGRESLGLGLYIARQIVLAHGGQIEVTSKPGVGTRFTITLPLGGR